MIRAYQEIVDFIASGTSPTSVVGFELSAATKDYIAELIHREKNGDLSEVETAELEHYLEYEHLMRLAKAKAHEHLTND